MTIADQNLRIPSAFSSNTRRLDARPSRLATTRILSETAHDLRSPLTSVRESIRLVAEGELGAVTESQFHCLADAIEVCDSMERLVADMLEIERLEAGRSRAIRSWFDLLPVCHSVSNAVSSTLRPRNITILWDGIEASTPRVFGDPEKIRRLLSNLITNAARETAEHHQVLIRAQRIHEGHTLRLSVIDSGRGMNVEDWNRAAVRGVSHHNSEGLGLAICRQLASAHHSVLTIVSRLEIGTEVSFELPVCGATSVATQWTQWRGQQSFKTKPRRADGDSETVIGMGQLRTIKADDSEIILLHHEGPPPIHANTCSLLTAVVGAAVSSKAVQSFDEILQRDQRAYDLTYRAADRRWVVLWDANREEAIERAEMLSLREVEGERLRVTWSEPRTVKLNTSQATVVIADAFTREALIDREPAGLVDDDMSLDGGTTFAQSAIPSQRLQAELVHLASRIGQQSKKLISQSVRTRPS